MPSPEPYFLSIREQGTALREGRLSAVALAKAYLERSRTVGTRLNAFVTLTPENQEILERWIENMPRRPHSLEVWI